MPAPRRFVLGTLWFALAGLCVPCAQAADAHQPWPKVLLSRSSLPLAASDSQILADYGSFVLARVAPDALSRLQTASERKPEPVQDSILLRSGAYTPTEGRVEAALASGTPQLWMIQLQGPTKDGWLDAIRATGARVVAFIPNHTYVVWADPARTSSALAPQTASFVRWQGPYRPQDRVAPQLSGLQTSAPRPVDLTVQVADVPDAAETLRQVRALATTVVHERLVAGYRDLAVTMSSDRIAQVAALPAVFYVEPRYPKIKLDESQDQIVAGQMTGNHPSGPGYVDWFLGKGFNDDGKQFHGFVVEIADDCADLSGHPDIDASRVVYQTNPTALTSQSGHGCLNAHIVAGLDQNTGADFVDANGFHYGLGVSPVAQIGITAMMGGPNDVNPSDYEPAAYSKGTRISSNSWGTLSHEYDASAQEVDALVRDSRPGDAGNQQLIMLFAAGNSGADGPSSVLSPATAKNVLAVGASEGVRTVGVSETNCPNIGPTDSDNASDLATFSSLGPVAPPVDGRFRPDIVAPGSQITGGAAQVAYTGSAVCLKYFPPGQTLYTIDSGTSQATPATAGAASLLYQYFLNVGQPAPSPAMIKAYLVATSTYIAGQRAGGTLPSNGQGFGRVNLERAFDNASDVVFDQTTVFHNSGEISTQQGVVADPNLPFRVALAWTDAVGSIGGSPLVNDLDLEVTVGPNTYKGNVFSGANSVTGGSADRKNNLECVFLPPGTSGNFTVTVRAQNIAGDGIPGNGDATDQDFALAMYNAAFLNQTPISSVPAFIVLLTLNLALLAAAARRRRRA